MIPHLHLAWPQERLGWSLHGHKAWAPALGTLCPLMRYWTGEGLSVLQPAHLQLCFQMLGQAISCLQRTSPLQLQTWSPCLAGGC